MLESCFVLHVYEANLLKRRQRRAWTPAVGLDSSARGQGRRGGAGRGVVGRRRVETRPLPNQIKRTLLPCDFARPDPTSVCLSDRLTVSPFHSERPLFRNNLRKEEEEEKEGVAGRGGARESFSK